MVPAPKCCPIGVAKGKVPSLGQLAVFNYGRYDLHLPKRVCNTCHYEWTPDWGDLIRSGYWPASVNGDTLYSTDVFKSFEDLKTGTRFVQTGLFTDAGTEETALWEDPGKRYMWYQPVVSCSRYSKKSQQA
ncbi:hypothetical protein NQZ68_008505 [Dissostichus eleginoides]|nr:hypothetical protein NQZ68_008505 [Dissostichus eleginoides]